MWSAVLAEIFTIVFSLWLSWSLRLVLFLFYSSHHKFMYLCVCTNKILTVWICFMLNFVPDNACSRNQLNVKRTLLCVFWVLKFNTIKSTSNRFITKIYKLIYVIEAIYVIAAESYIPRYIFTNMVNSSTPKYNSHSQRCQYYLTKYTFFYFVLLLWDK